MFHFISMKIINFKDFLRKFNFKDDTINEPHLQSEYNHCIYPRNSKKYSDRGFINIDNGSWVCFIVPYSIIYSIII